MPFKIIRADITTLDVDAIVNAANNHLQSGGGVCGAIFSAAGENRLSKACNKIGFCPTGGAVITSGFNLKAKYIIHTVGPVYGANKQKEAEELYSCYINSLNLAKKHAVTSIAFPLISSGIYGYPKNEALTIATSAILKFISENEMDVYLTVYDKLSFSTGKQLFKDIESYISDNMVVPDMRRTALRSYIKDPGAQYAPPTASSSTVASSSSLSIEDIFSKESESFSKMLFRLIDERGMNDVDVYKRANIDRKLFSKMRKADYAPKKITVMALVIALRLNMSEAKDLLCAAGFAFSPANRFDLIIQYFIERGEYDIYTINETLFVFNQPLLGA